MYKQIIIARKDLGMSPGKLAAQVSHGSMAFLTNAIKKNVTARTETKILCSLPFDKDLFDEWINGSFTKIILEAKNKYQLEKAVMIAKEIGLEEGKDFFQIRDNCLTELEPEDNDGRTLTCIGFRPLDAEAANKISKKFHLWV